MESERPDHSTNQEPSYSRSVSPSSISSVVMDWANDIVPEAVPPPPIPLEKTTVSLTNENAPNNPNPSSPDLDVQLLERVVKAAPQVAKEAAAVPSPTPGFVPFLADIPIKVTETLFIGPGFNDTPVKGSRAPTSLELVNALCSGNRTFFNVPHKDDDESQAQVISPDSLFASKLAQSLTLAGNIKHVFEIKQLSNGDFAQVDAFLKHDLYVLIRELITKEITIPAPSQIKEGYNGDFAIFHVVSAVKALPLQVNNLTQLHVEIATHPVGHDHIPTILEWIDRLNTLEANINTQKSIIQRNLLPRLLSYDSSLEKIAKSLHQFGVSGVRLDYLIMSADTALNYAFTDIASLTKALQVRYQVDHSSAQEPSSTAQVRPSSSHSCDSCHSPPRQPFVVSETWRRPAGSQRRSRSRSRSPQRKRSCHSFVQDVSTIPPKHYKGCVFCHGKRHFSALCPDVKLIMERADILIQEGHCINCIGVHPPNLCKRRSPCMTCHDPHHHHSICMFNKDDHVLTIDTDETPSAFYQKVKGVCSHLSAPSSSC
ncbi:hypothetical protein Aduo_015949 [Ancylostoma duodenale]